MAKIISNPLPPHGAKRYPQIILRVWNKHYPKNKWYFILDYDNWYSRGWFEFTITEFYPTGALKSEYFNLIRNEKRLYHVVSGHLLPLVCAGFDFIENAQITFTIPKKSKPTNELQI